MFAEVRGILVKGEIVTTVTTAAVVTNTAVQIIHQEILPLLFAEVAAAIVEVHTKNTILTEAVEGDILTKMIHTLQTTAMTGIAVEEI